jgi:hypothetical protein
MTHDSRLPGQPSTDSTEVVRADLGGWISGPCLSGQPAGLMASNRPSQDPTRACAPAVLGTVLAVAQLGAELPSWRVHQSSAGFWVGIRAATASAEPVRLTRLLLPILETAMYSAELAIVRTEYPQWNIRRTEHGRDWSATPGGGPALVGRTLGELAAQIAKHDQRPDRRADRKRDSQ